MAVLRVHLVLIRVAGLERLRHGGAPVALAPVQRRRMLPAEHGIVVRVAAHVGDEGAAALVLVVVLVGPGAVKRYADIAIRAACQARIQADVDAVRLHFAEVVVQVQDGVGGTIGIAQEQGLVFFIVAVDGLLGQG